jgi:hypothetical protein
MVLVYNGRLYIDVILEQYISNITTNNREISNITTNNRDIKLQDPFGMVS